MSTAHDQELDKFLKKLLDDSDDADKEETDRGEGENEEEFEEL